MPRSCQSRAMLVAARNSQDFARCARATVSARSKYASACDEPSCGNFSAISPAIRLISASYHRSFVVSTALIASEMPRQASSNWPSSAWVLDKCDKKIGKYTLDPVDRYMAIPGVIIWIASEDLPDSANTQPFCIVPNAFHKAAPFSSANRTTSLDCSCAAAYFAQRTLVNDVWNCAYIKVPAWPSSRAFSSARSASASAVSG